MARLKTPQTVPQGRSRLLEWLVIGLVGEKIIQHLFVTWAFAVDWRGIGATVVVDPRLLLVLGALLAAAFALSLWGMGTRRAWALDLAIVLALFDIVGEFVAQGRIGIQITVSFVVAVLLLVTALMLRRHVGASV